MLGLIRDANHGKKAQGHIFPIPARHDVVLVVISFPPLIACLYFFAPQLQIILCAAVTSSLDCQVIKNIQSTPPLMHFGIYLPHTTFTTSARVPTVSSLTWPISLFSYVLIILLSIKHFSGSHFNFFSLASKARLALARLTFPTLSLPHVQTQSTLRVNSVSPLREGLTELSHVLFTFVSHTTYYVASEAVDIKSTLICAGHCTCLLTQTIPFNTVQPPKWVYQLHFPQEESRSIYKLRNFPRVIQVMEKPGFKPCPGWFSNPCIFPSATVVFYKAAGPLHFFW